MVLTLLSILPAHLNPKSMATLFGSFCVSVGVNQQLPTSIFCMAASVCHRNINPQSQQASRDKNL